MKTQIRTLLRADVPLAALTSQISWVQRPPASGLPAIIISTVSPDTSLTFEGKGNLSGDMLQFDIWSQTFAAADQIRNALLKALQRGGTVDGVEFTHAFLSSERQMTEDVSGIGILFRYSLDIVVWWKDL